MCRLVRYCQFGSYGDTPVQGGCIRQYRSIRSTYVSRIPIPFPSCSSTSKMMINVLNHDVFVVGLVGFMVVMKLIVNRIDFGRVEDMDLNWYIEPPPGRQVVFVLRDTSGETFTSGMSFIYEYCAMRSYSPV